MEAKHHIKNNIELERLRDKLSLQRLQINRLLEITQAINDNISIEDLFELYNKTMSFEMQLQKFALYTRSEEKWSCVTSAGIDEILIEKDITDRLSEFKKKERIDEQDHAVLSHFSIVIPVYHKDYAIAYAFAQIDWSDIDRYDVSFIEATTNVIAVAIENKRLFKRQLEQERMRREMELAIQVQNMLIPTSLPNNDVHQFSGIYQPHKGVGGDYYDFLEVGHEEIAFCIADISGKGMAAAILMSNFQANLQSLVHRKYLSVKKFINRLNALVLRTTKGEKFITFFIARYHQRKKRLRYICAGHNPPFMYSGGKIHRLDKGCTILGAFERIPQIDFGEIFLEDDALFLLYTDGLTDLQNGNEDFFDDDCVEQFILDNHELEVDLFNEKLMEHLNEFKGDNPFPDDISVLTGKLFINNYVPIDTGRTDKKKGPENKFSF